MEQATLVPAHAGTMSTAVPSTTHVGTFTPSSLFSPIKRRLIFIIVCLAGVIGPLSTLTYTPALSTIATELGVTISQVNLTITTYLIFQGITPSLWGTMGDMYGRRLLYIATSAISMGAYIGLSITNQYVVVLVLRALQAAGSSSARALGAGVIRDLWPQSERGGYMGMYSAGIGIGTAFGPVLGGVLAQYTTWHGIFYFLLALSALCLLTVILLLPETLHSVVKTGVDRLPWYSRPPIPFLCPTSAPHAIYHSEPRPKVDILGPLRLLAHWDVGCIVTFTGVYYAVWQDSMVATSTVYADRYHLNQAEIGLTYLSNGVGSLVGNVLVGKILDYDYRKLLESENRRRGALYPKVRVSKIEHARLKSLTYAAPMFVTCIIAFGWVVQARVSIATSVVISFFTGWFDSSILTTYSTLMLDLFEERASASSALIDLVRCLLGAVSSSTVQPMIQDLGEGWTFTVLGGICIACLPLMWVQWRYGALKRAKRATVAVASEKDTKLSFELPVLELSQQQKMASAEVAPAIWGDKYDSDVVNRGCLTDSDASGTMEVEAVERPKDVGISSNSSM